MSFKVVNVPSQHNLEYYLNNLSKLDFGPHYTDVSRWEVFQVVTIPNGSNAFGQASSRLQLILKEKPYEPNPEDE